ncbi:MAG: hypothetical protein K0S23_1183 [Fluviicola sp.]|jgi:hypothetical protein|nr:hypothetical protein [Fluviicola sp.]
MANTQYRSRTDQVWIKYGYSMKDVCECEGFNKSPSRQKN